MDTFAAVQAQVDKVAKVLKLSETEKDVLLTPKRTLQANFPVKMDNGRVKYFRGYRVQFNDARGPAKGGIRFHHEVDISEVMSLAFWMAVKCAVVNIPYGGGKGGVVCNPKELSPRELEALSRGFVRAMHQFIGPELDIPAPDVYTTPQIMAWMLDEYETIKGGHYPALITGKPLVLGGSLVRDKATALGGAFILRDLAVKMNLGKNPTVAVQGFGNAGLTMAEILHSWGYKVIAVSDSKGGIFQKTGLDIPAVVKAKESGSVGSFNAEKITNEELLTLEVDILVPAALSGEITEKNAGEVKAKVILELANGPTTPAADEILFKKGIPVVPDVLANAGGVTVSYFEWVQNRQGYYWTEHEASSRLETIMRRSFEEVYAFSKELKTDLRTSAHALAVRRILDAERLRGHL